MSHVAKPWRVSSPGFGARACSLGFRVEWFCEISGVLALGVLRLGLGLLVQLVTPKP